MAEFLLNCPSKRKNELLRVIREDTSIAFKNMWGWSQNSPYKGPFDMRNVAWVKWSDGD